MFLLNITMKKFFEFRQAVFEMNFSYLLIEVVLNLIAVEIFHAKLLCGIQVLHFSHDWTAVPQSSKNVLQNIRKNIIKQKFSKGICEFSMP